MLSLISPFFTQPIPFLRQCQEKSLGKLKGDSKAALLRSGDYPRPSFSYELNNATSLARRATIPGSTFPPAWTHRGS
jgi:hypothetical protein